jgi:hypothetical protein
MKKNNVRNLEGLTLEQIAESDLAIKEEEKEAVKAPDPIPEPSAAETLTISVDGGRLIAVGSDGSAVRVGHDCAAHHGLKPGSVVEPLKIFGEGPEATLVGCRLIKLGDGCAPAPKAESAKAKETATVYLVKKDEGGRLVAEGPKGNRFPVGSKTGLKAGDAVCIEMLDAIDGQMTVVKASKVEATVTAEPAKNGYVDPVDAAMRRLGLAH